MKSDDKKSCTDCGIQLSPNSDSCPVCMLRVGLEVDVESNLLISERGALKPERPVQRFEHYEVLQSEDGKLIELGRGSMGVTYKAIDIHLQCPVTLKLINEKYLRNKSARTRFLREARMAASLRHPNVASVFYLGSSGGGYFYAMEFVEGETLESVIQRSGRLAVNDAWINHQVNVVTIVAWAGVGKSTLVNHWLRQMAAEQYRSAQLVFGWSFYRQGTSEGSASADEFLDAALLWFGDPDPRIGTAWEKVNGWPS